ncbi:zinc-binding dehydrogenase [Williamsia sp.]|uniref:zinc-binding dehydrogenase n=1 Tax=Williamsia sp. TaxID=1872085 RepID=UPI002F93805A
MNATAVHDRQTMRAIEVREFGDPQVLRLVDAPIPSPKPGQVLIEVAVADVMFLDVRLRSGWGTDYFTLPLPYVPGGGVGGTVVGVADDEGISLLGRRVISRTAASGIGRGLPIGGYAEFALADAGTVVPVPDELALDVATALVHDGRTALAAFEGAQIRPGERVLITAAAGGLGTLLTQLSTRAGAEVIAGVSSAAKAELSTALGATDAVRYTTDDWPEQVRQITGNGVDMVFDGTGGSVGGIAAATLRPGGRFIGYGSAAGTFADLGGSGADVSATALSQLNADPYTGGQSLLHRVIQIAASGDLRVQVGQTYALADAATAHTTIESRRSLGRTLLLMTP